MAFCHTKMRNSLFDSLYDEVSYIGHKSDIETLVDSNNYGTKQLRLIVISTLIMSIARPIEILYTSHLQCHSNPINVKCS